MRRAFLLALLFVPQFSFGNILIYEIMYDLEGSDRGREWIELKNNGSEPVSIEGWTIYENDINHKLSLYRGNSFLISPGDYVIVADRPEKFIVDWPDYSGVIIDSAFSLSNSGESLILKNGDNIVFTTVFSSVSGASGDGNSLFLSGTTWLAGRPTPGGESVVYVPPVKTKELVVPRVSKKDLSTEADEIYDDSMVTTTVASSNLSLEENSFFSENKWYFMLGGVILMGVFSYFVFNFEKKSEFLIIDKSPDFN